MVLCCIPGCCCSLGWIAPSPFNTVKWFYLTSFTIFCIFVWVQRDYADDILDWLPSLDKCKPDPDEFEGVDIKEAQSICYGKEAVYRVTFGTFLFFLIHAISLIKVKDNVDFRKYLHNACWILQLAAWIGLIVAMYFIPEGVIEVWAWIAKFLGAIYLILQLVLFVDSAYKINQYLLDRDDCLFTLIAGSAGFYIASFTFIILTGVFFVPKGSCSVQIFWIFFTPLLGLVVTGLSLSPWRAESSGLFTSGVLFVYCSWLLLSATSSLPSSHTSSLRDGSTGECVRGDPPTRWIELIGFFGTIAALAVATMSAGTAGESFGLDLEDPEEGEESDVAYRPDFFHFVYALASAYVAQVFTNWSTEGTIGEWEIERGSGSAWIKIVTQWVCFVIYGWTIIAPKVLSGRDF